MLSNTTRDAIYPKVFRQPPISSSSTLCSTAAACSKSVVPYVVPRVKAHTVFVLYNKDPLRRLRVMTDRLSMHKQSVGMTK